MRPEDQAELLRAWLDGDVDHPPEGLDIDVIESIQALRPELAAPPSLTAGDILAGLDLAPAVDEPRAEILAFPTAPVSPSTPSVPASLPQPERTSVWAMLGTAGAFGLLAAAAAVTLVTLYAPSYDEALVAMEAPFEEDEDEKSDTRMEERAPAPPARKPAPTSATTESPPDEPSMNLGQRARVGETRAPAAPGGAMPTIAAAKSAPPASDTFASDAPADLDEEAEALEDEADDLETLDEEAPAELAAPAPEPEPEPAPAPMAAEARSVESAMGIAAGQAHKRKAHAKSSNTWVEDDDSGAVRSEAERLTALVAPPPEIGQLRALEASALWVELGELARSEAVLRAGLDLSQANTPSRSRLLRALAETLQARGDRREARALRAQADELDAER